MAISSPCAAVLASSTVTGCWAQVPSASKGVRQNQTSSVPQRLGPGLPLSHIPTQHASQRGAQSRGRLGMLPGQWGSLAPPRHGHPKQGAEGQWGPAGAGGLDAYPRCMSPFQEGLPALPHCHWFGDTKQTGQEGSCGASLLRVRGSCHPTPQHRGTKHRCRPWQKWNPAGDELCSEPSRVPRPAACCHRRCFAASLREDAAGSTGPPHVASPRWELWSQPQGHAHGVGAPRSDSGGGSQAQLCRRGSVGVPLLLRLPRDTWPGSTKWGWRQSGARVVPPLRGG